MNDYFICRAWKQTKHDIASQGIASAVCGGTKTTQTPARE